MFPAQGCPHPSCALSLAGNRNIWEQAAYPTKFGAQNSETETAEGNSHCREIPCVTSQLLPSWKQCWRWKSVISRLSNVLGRGYWRMEMVLGKRKGWAGGFFASIRDFCLGINEMRFYSCILSCSMTAADFFLLSPRRLRSSGEI